MNSPSFEVSPGIGAFFAFFFLAVALWLLMRNMFARLRRMNLAQRQAEQEARQAARAKGAASSGDDADAAGGAGTDSGGGDGPEEGERRGDEV